MRIQVALIGMLAVLVAVSIVGCGAEPTTEAPSSQAEAPVPDEQAQEAPAATTPVPMGQPATSGDWTVTVKETGRETSTGGAEAAEGKGSGPFTWTFTPFVEGGATPAVLEVK